MSLFLAGGRFDVLDIGFDMDVTAWHPGVADACAYRWQSMGSIEPWCSRKVEVEDIK
jgi:hypothetical protein